MDQLLSVATVGQVPIECAPQVDRAALKPRMAHFGLGAFHRAHQALYTTIADAQTGEDWGTVGLIPNSRASLAQFRNQDCLYSVTERSAAGSHTQVLATILEAHHLMDDAAKVQSLIASPSTEILSLTVTEKGYNRLPGSGALDTANPGIAADLASDTPSTVIGHVACGLAARFRAGGAPLTVISCDNISGNGTGLEKVVLDFIDAVQWNDKAAILEWIGTSVRFPNTLVDRIVPVPTDADRQAAATTLGLRDDLAIGTEDYRQWVIEDTFTTTRPHWELAGAQFTADVKPFELTKLRLLNGSHSMLAYLGLSAGVATVNGAMHTAWGPALVQKLSDQAAPTLPAGGPDRMSYTAALLDRFANPAMVDQLNRIGCDGSQKIPERWLGALRQLRAENLPHDVYAWGLAGWANAVMPPVQGNDQRFGTSDPKATALAACWDGATSTQAVRNLLTQIGAEDLAEDQALVAEITDRLPAVQAGNIEID
jgi:fructuronate reductase